MSRGRSQRSLELIKTAIRILERIQPASVRAICYQLFMASLILNMGKTFTNSVSRLLARAREEGQIPWDWIVDESRAAEVARHWTGPEALIKAAVQQYRRNNWQDQDCRIEVWSEKGTIRGTLAPVLAEYGVTFRVMHGYASATVVNEIAEESNASEKPLTALYLGDWDPSGLHMSEVDLPQRLDQYGANLELTRIALLRDDLEGLPSFEPETKAHDARYCWFMSNIDTQCYELDAMSPPDLRARVETEIRKRINLPVWKHACEVERVEVESMQEFHKSWQASLCSGQKP
jgi:hypothetical protein